MERRRSTVVSDDRIYKADIPRQTDKPRQTDQDRQTYQKRQTDQHTDQDRQERDRQRQTVYIMKIAIFGESQKGYMCT